jgi:hypothetical protein
VSTFQCCASIENRGEKANKNALAYCVAVQAVAPKSFTSLSNDVAFFILFFNWRFSISLLVMTGSLPAAVLETKMNSTRSIFQPQLFNATFFTIFSLPVPAVTAGLKPSILGL